MLSFIPMPNVFTIEGKEKVTGDEWYVYYYLCLNELRFYRCQIVLSIDSIAHNIQIRRGPDRNKAAIKEAIQGLVKKEHVTVDKDNFANSIPLVIHKQEEHYYQNRLEAYKNGFEQIFKYIFDAMNDVPETKRGIYFLVCSYIKKVKREISFSEWSFILGYTDKQVRNIIDDMEARDIIVRQIGRYYLNNKNEPQQEINMYYVPSEKEIGIINEPNNDSKEIDGCILVDISQGNNRGYITKRFNIDDIIIEIYNWECKLYYQHFYYANKYKEYDSKSFDQYQKRRDALSKGNKFDFTGYEKQFLRDMHQEEMKNQKEKEKTRNALTYYGSDEKVYVDIANIEQIDFENVDAIYYLNRDNRLSDIKFTLIAGIGILERDQLSDEAFNYMVQRYKDIVYRGKMTTQKDLEYIRGKVQVKSD